MGFSLSMLENFSRDSSRDKQGKTVKIIKASIEPLKMGRVKDTGKTRAIACRVSVTYENNQTKHHHVDTLKGGIFVGYQFAQELILKNMKERGVA